MSSPFGLKELMNDLERFPASAPLAEAKTPPASWYTQAAYWDLEKEWVFQNRWIYAGRADQLRNPGDVITGCFLGKPYLILKDENNCLRAFHNICSHHGARLVQGDGQLKKLVCPYHGWTYNLQGQLVRAVRSGLAETESLGLKPIAVSELGAFVFLAFSPEQKSLQWGAEKAMIEDLCDVQLKFVKRVRYPMNCNWKVFVDNFLDGGYHVPHLHRDLAANLRMNSYGSQLGENFSLQTCQAAKAPNDERIGEAARYFWLYPNLMINRYGKWMDVNWVIPLGPNRCEIVFDYFYGGDPEPTLVEDALCQSDQVQQEDMQICGDVQVNLAAGAYDQGVYAPEFEAPMFLFHQLLYQDFKNGLAQPPG